MNDSALQFSQPAWILLGLVLVALGLWLFGKADRRRRADLDKLAHPRFQQRLIAGWSPALRWIRRGLWLAAIMLLAVAAARPQFGYEWREVKRRGIDILFAVDTSQSMLAQDLTPNRLERARLGILDFLDRLEGDRVGLVPFAGSAFALCPLTLDYDAFRESLNSINTDLIPRQGTDLASAIREADRLFDAEGNNQRFLVLITDGEDLQGEAVAAAEEAKKNGTTIYTVGVGAADGQLIPVRDRYGRQAYLTDQSGERVRTKLDEETLRKIAELTGGLYVPLGRGAEGLDAIYQQRLSLAPKSELAQKLEKVPLERYQWPLGAALLMLALQAVLGERKPERKRKAVVSVARRVRPVAVVAAAFILASVDACADRKAYNAGTEAYRTGEFEQAAEQLEASLKTPDLSLQQKSYYNLGNSLFRIGQGMLQEDTKKTMESWKKAIKAYEDSLALDATDEDAQFNRDFVKRKLDELKQQEEKKDQQDNEQKKDDQKQDKQDEQKDKRQKEDQQGGDEGDQKDQQKQDSKEGKSGDNQDEGEPQQDQKGEDGESKPGPGKEGADDQPKDEQSGGDAEAKEKGDSGDEKKPEDGDKGEQGQDKKEKNPDGDDPSDQNAGMKGQEEKKPEDRQKPDGQAAETGKPGEKGKQGEAAGGAAAQDGEERVEGEMSREEAMRLLDSLGGDERIVIPVPLTGENRDNTTKGKTW